MSAGPDEPIRRPAWRRLASRLVAGGVVGVAVFVGWSGTAAASPAEPSEPPAGPVEVVVGGVGDLLGVLTGASSPAPVPPPAAPEPTSLPAMPEPPATPAPTPPPPAARRPAAPVPPSPNPAPAPGPDAVVTEVVIAPVTRVVETVHDEVGPVVVEVATGIDRLLRSVLGPPPVPGPADPTDRLDPVEVIDLVDPLDVVDPADLVDPKDPATPTAPTRTAGTLATGADRSLPGSVAVLTGRAPAPSVADGAVEVVDSDGLGRAVDPTSRPAGPPTGDPPTLPAPATPVSSSLAGGSAGATVDASATVPSVAYELALVAVAYAVILLLVRRPHGAPSRRPGFSPD